MARSRKSQKNLNEELFYACRGSDLKRVQDLLQDGADPLWRNPTFYGRTCLHRAAIWGRTDIAKYLLDNTRLCEQVDILDDYSWTPCHWAARQGHLEMTRLLINYGASRHRRNEDGATLLDIARGCGHHDVVDYLVTLDAADAEKAQTALQIAMKKGSIKVYVLKLLVIGPPGSGKTCTKHLLLGVPPPQKRSSTPIATKAVRAISFHRVKTDGSKIVHWEEMDNDKYLEFIAQEVKLLELNQSRLLSSPPQSTTRPTTSTSTAQQDVDNGAQLVLATEDPQTTPIKSNTSTGDETKVSIDLSKGTFGKIVDKCVFIEPPKPSENSKPHQFIHLIDSGGQPSFLSLVPAFVRGCTVNIIVSKLPSRLSKHLPFEYVIDDEHLRQPTELSQSQLELIEELIRSLSSVIHTKLSHSKFSSEPRFLIIGTHADKYWPLFTETLAGKSRQIKQKLGKLNEMCINCHPYGDIILPVDTLSEKNRDELAAFIRQKIMEAHGSAAEIEIPTRWYVFELEVDSKAKKEDRGVLSVVECFEIGRKLGMGEEEVDAALRYLDGVALCLYFKDAVPHLVFPDPQVILNELTELMNIGIIDFKHISSHYPIQAVKKLRDEGLFNKELVAMVCSKFRVSEDKCSYTVENFLTILEHLLIVAQVVIKEQEFFFLPAILPLVKKQPLYCKELATLYLVCRSGVNPLGLFPALVVSLLSKSTFMHFVLYESQYRNCVQLLCKFGGVVQLIERHAWIEVAYNGDPAMASHIRLVLHQAIFRVCMQRQLDTEKIGFDDGFLCPFIPKCETIVHPCLVTHSNNWLTCSMKPAAGSEKCSDPMKLAWLNGDQTTGDSVQSPPNSSTSQDGVESTPQLSVHSDTHQLCSDTRTADHSSSYISLREQTPHKPSGATALTGTPTQNTISQILTKNYVDLHRVMSINPDNMAAHLYSAELIGDSTLSYVTTATGVSHQTVAHRLVQECKAIIISHDHPTERMRKLLEILSDEPCGKTLADRISEQCSVQFSPNLSTSQDGSESTPQLSVRFDTHHLPSDTRTADHSSSYISVREQTPYKPSGSHEVVDTVAYKLQQHRFPPQKWNVLATCLRMASVVQEIDADERHVQDRLQALVVRWASTAEQGNLWETLVEAVYMCEERVIAMKLAEEMGVVYPGQESIHM